MTTPDLAGLCERLRAKRYTREDWHEPYGAIDLTCDADDYGAEAVNRNPDGPEAAAAIERLVELSWKNLSTMERSARRFSESGRSHAELDDAITETRTALEGASDDR